MLAMGEERAMGEAPVPASGEEQEPTNRHTSRAS